MKRTPATMVLTALAVGATSLAAAAHAPSSGLEPSDMRPSVSRDGERVAADLGGAVEHDRGMAANGARYTAQARAVAASDERPPSSDVGRYGAAVFASLLDQGLSRGMAASGARLAAEAAAYNAGHGSGTAGHGVTVAARP